jgi:tripartite-type tricarboxylate transporter receptor subunit TctC
MRPSRALRASFAGRAGALLLAFAAVVATLPAQAQSPAGAYPNRPIRVIVPFLAGGPSDTVARLLAPGIAERLGQPLVIENRPGASANLGTEMVAKSPGDGYTLLLASTYIVVNPGLYKDLRYDVLRDLTPVAMADLKPMVLVASPAFAPNSIREIIAAAQAKPGSINFASPGTGTLPHLAGELFNTRAGVRLVHVPYKGIPPAQVDLMNGQVQLMFDAVTSALPHVRSGRLKAVAAPSSARYVVLPDVPTVAEAGLAGVELVAWDGFFVPASTTREIVDRLHQAIAAAIGHPETSAKMTGMGMVISTETREQFAARVRDEMKMWLEVVRASGARAD